MILPTLVEQWEFSVFDLACTKFRSQKHMSICRINTLELIAFVGNICTQNQCIVSQYIYRFFKSTLDSFTSIYYNFPLSDQSAISIFDRKRMSPYLRTILMWQISKTCNHVMRIWRVYAKTVTKYLLHPFSNKIESCGVKTLPSHPFGTYFPKKMKTV